MWRKLAAANPTKYQPELARSVRNLGGLLEQGGRHEEAVTAAQEAVEMWRELAAANPDMYRGELADALGRLRQRLRRVGRENDIVAGPDVTQDANPQAENPRPGNN
jgi:hypothetical protein